MLRDVDINEISDGRKYHAEDMVKVGCGDCAGCSSCCRGMDDLIILDPLDACRLKTACNMSFEELLSGAVKLSICDGLILPSLRMREDGACFFLNKEERCAVHPARPGICRLFPLGRVYEDGSFYYILQTGECEKSNRTKVKVRKWLGIEDLASYERFVNRWHYFLKAAGERSETADEATRKQISLYLLGQFYYKNISAENFYTVIEALIREAEDILDLA